MTGIEPESESIRICIISKISSVNSHPGFQSLRVEGTFAGGRGRFSAAAAIGVCRSLCLKILRLSSSSLSCLYRSAESACGISIFSFQMFLQSWIHLDYHLKA